MEKIALRNIQESVPIQCFVCGCGYHVLSSHLRAHNLTSVAYRQEFDLPEKAPLHSEAYTSLMRLIAFRPTQLVQSKKLPLEWNEGYRHAIGKLAEAGYFVPSEAARFTGIPVTTIYTAMQFNGLPYAEASILVHLGSRDNVRVIGSRQPVRLIFQSDLTSYALRHRSLRGKSG